MTQPECYFSNCDAEFSSAAKGSLPPGLFKTTPQSPTNGGVKAEAFSLPPCPANTPRASATRSRCRDCRTPFWILPSSGLPGFDIPPRSLVAERFLARGWARQCSFLPTDGLSSAPLSCLYCHCSFPFPNGTHARNICTENLGKLFNIGHPICQCAEVGSNAPKSAGLCLLAMPPPNLRINLFSIAHSNPAQRVLLWRQKA